MIVTTLEYTMEYDIVGYECVRRYMLFILGEESSMVAILDMKKPKSCIECDVHIAHDYCDHFSQFGVGAKTDGVYSDCPLINVVWCRECKHWDETIEGHINVDDHLCRRRLWWTIGNDFCSDGERKDDDHI